MIFSLYLVNGATMTSALLELDKSLLLHQIPFDRREILHFLSNLLFEFLLFREKIISQWPWKNVLSYPNDKCFFLSWKVYLTPPLPLSTPLYISEYIIYFTRYLFDGLLSVNLASHIDCY